MSKIYAYHTLAMSIRAGAKDMPDNVQGELDTAVTHLQKAIHLTKAQSQADLEIKFGLWTELIDCPECILLEHREHWKSFMQDFELLRPVDSMIMVQLFTALLIERGLSWVTYQAA